MNESIIKILPNGFMNVAYDSRPSEVKKIHIMDDIVMKSTRICSTMDQLSYKEQQISMNPKSKPYKFLK